MMSGKNFQDEIDYYIGFSVFPGIGPVKFRYLLEKFGSAQSAWNSGKPALDNIIGPALARNFFDFRNKFDILNYRRRLETLEITALPITDHSYPYLLKQISDPPFLIYVRGKNWETVLKSGKFMAVVGTRKITAYGRIVTGQLVEPLARNGLCIVSGMALGVDCEAHACALKSGGMTVAVLGCGADLALPAGNSGLYREIITCGRGCVISEMPLGHIPQKGVFIARNRIVSGLSSGVLVVEGTKNSGSLITARYASVQGREVMAVPGPITSPYSQAASILIKNGAQLVENTDDVYSALDLPKPDIAKTVNCLKLEPNEQKVVDCLKNSGSVFINIISQDCNLTPSQTAATLTMLMIKGIVRDCGNKVYSLV